MDRKTIMGLAAVAGIGLLLYMRKAGADDTLANASALMSGGTAWHSDPIPIYVPTAPTVVDPTPDNPPARHSDPIPVYNPPTPPYAGVQGTSTAPAASGIPEGQSRWSWLLEQQGVK